MIDLFVTEKAFRSLISKGPDSRWYNIIIKYLNKIYIYASKAEIDNLYEEPPETSEIGILLKSYSIQFVSSISIIDEIMNDHSVILNYPSGIFFMNISAGDAKSIQKDYGVICKNEDDTDTNILDEEKEISCINNDKRHDWKEFFKEIANSPTNSIIICDRYLFSNDDTRNTNGQDNLIDILDSILPKSFKGEYHILLLCSDIKNNDFNKLSKSLHDNIKKLRRYRILFEMVQISSGQLYYENTHNRRIITNYHVIRAEHKFNAMNNGKWNCSQVINWDMLFSKGLTDKSDAPYISHNILVNDIKEITKYGTDHSKTCGYSYSNNGVRTEKDGQIIFSGIENRLIKQ